MYRYFSFSIIKSFDVHTKFGCHIIVGNRLGNHCPVGRIGAGNLRSTVIEGNVVGFTQFDGIFHSGVSSTDNQNFLIVSTFVKVVVDVFSDGRGDRIARFVGFSHTPDGNNNIPSQIVSTTGTHMKDPFLLRNLVHFAAEMAFDRMLVNLLIKEINRTLLGTVHKWHAPFHLDDLSLPVFVDAFVIFIEFTNGVGVVVTLLDQKNILHPQCFGFNRCSDPARSSSDNNHIIDCGIHLFLLFGIS